MIKAISNVHECGQSSGYRNKLVSTKREQIFSVKAGVCMSMMLVDITIVE